MKILITGASGLLGYKVTQLALRKGHEVYSLFNKNEIKLGTSIKLDITNQGAISKVITGLKPETIIHTAAYTNVDGCESNRNLAWKANVEATRNIALESALIKAYLIYVSTDYVFDGEKGFYSEEDQTNPINHYGYTKLKGEEFVKTHSQEWCITRTSVIFGWEKTEKLNFATWIINKLKQRKDVKVLTDQYVSPTLNTNLAEMLLEIADRRIGGILHTAGATRINRYEFALRLAEVFKLDKQFIYPAVMNEMLWKAKRPKNSSLNVNRALSLLNQKPLKLDQTLELMSKKLTS